MYLSPSLYLSIFLSQPSLSLSQIIRRNRRYNRHKPTSFTRLLAAPKKYIRFSPGNSHTLTPHHTTPGLPFIISLLIFLFRNRTTCSKYSNIHTFSELMRWTRVLHADWLPGCENRRFTTPGCWCRTEGRRVRHAESVSCTLTVIAV